MLRFGRRAPKRARSIPLSAILTPAARAGEIPPHPVAEDYLATVAGELQMLGNDRYGDCAAVTWANWRLMLTAILGPRAVYPTFDQVEQVYRTQNPGFPTEDNGMVLQTELEWLATHDAPDGSRVLAFAEVNVRDRDELEAALAVFGCVWLGVEVQQGNMTDFQQGKPWDYHRGDEIVGGHAILAGGYRSDGSIQIATWGAETTLTDAFLDHLLEEAWVPIGVEHLGTRQFEAGIDRAALATAFEQITGRPFPAAPPPPTPTPDPGGINLTAAVATLASETHEWLGHHHVGANKAAADSLRRFLTAAGFTPLNP